MNKKTLLPSTVLAILCTVLVINALTFNRPGHSHAAGTASVVHAGKSAVASTSLSRVVVQGNVYYGSDDFSVYALNATTGTLIWKYQPSGYAGISLMGMHNGIAYVGLSDGPGGIGNVRFAALEAAGGGLRWLSSETIYGIFDLLRVVNGILYLNDNLGFGNGLVALNGSNGSLLWNYPAGGIQYGSSVSMVALSQGVVYTSYRLYSHGFAASVCALNASDGSQRWCDQNDSVLVFVKGTMYGQFYDITNATGDVIALNASDGSLLWSVSGASIADVVQNVVYAYNSHGYLCELNMSDGSQRWCSSYPGYAYVYLGKGIICITSLNHSSNQYTTGALRASDGSLLWLKQNTTFVSVYQGVVYAVGNGNELEAIKGSNGTFLWQYNLGTEAFGSSSLPLNGVFYYIDNNTSTLFALNATNGTLLWKHRFTSLPQLPTVVNGIAYVLTYSYSNGRYIIHVHALNGSNGTLLWSH